MADPGETGGEGARRPPPRSLDIAALVESNRTRGFALRLVVLSWFVTFFDGLDLMMISYTAPYLREEYSLSPQLLGDLFSAGTAGQIVGGFLFSWAADRYGRRPVIVGTAFAFGILTAGTALAGSFSDLLMLRFLDGLAIGGMLPIAWALNIEYAPRHKRSTVVTIIMLGYSIGAASAGPLTIFIAPDHGWRAVFVAGGAGTLVIAAALALWLPESLRHLVARGAPRERIMAILRRIGAGTVAIAPDQEIVLGDEAATSARFRVASLFEGRLAVITPLLWIGYMASALAIYFNGSWGPSLLETLSVDRTTSALVSSTGGLLGALAGVLLLHFSERRGPGWLVLYPALAIPTLLLLGLGLLPAPLMLPFVILATLFIGGGHSSVISIAGVFYPSAIRANGGGWATSIAKIGGFAGPLIGGAVLASGLPVLRTYALLALCPGLLLACLAAIVVTLRNGPARTPGTAGDAQGRPST